MAIKQDNKKQIKPLPVVSARLACFLGLTGAALPPILHWSTAAMVAAIAMTMGTLAVYQWGRRAAAIPAREQTNHNPLHNGDLEMICRIADLAGEQLDETCRQMNTAILTMTQSFAALVARLDTAGETISQLRETLDKNPPDDDPAQQRMVEQRRTVDRMEQLSASLLENGMEIRKDINRILESLQFHDRVNQILCHVKNGFSLLSEEVQSCRLQANDEGRKQIDNHKILSVFAQSNLDRGSRVIHYGDRAQIPKRDIEFFP